MGQYQFFKIDTISIF